MLGFEQIHVSTLIVIKWRNRTQKCLMSPLIKCSILPIETVLVATLDIFCRISTPASSLIPVTTLYLRKNHKMITEMNFRILTNIFLLIIFEGKFEKMIFRANS